MTVQEIINNIQESDSIDFNNSFAYCKKCAKLLRDENTDEDGRKILIHILDNWGKIDDLTKEMWIELLEAEGFYPYIDKEGFRLEFTTSKLRKHMSKSKNLDYYLHDEQLYVKNLIDSGKNVIVSAPTSFGKSLLIEEIVAEDKYKNIVIIQPTLALLDETRKKLKKYDEQYKIIVRTSQKPSEEKGNLFLLTAERVMEYHELPKIDFLIIDEFYKLSAKRDDERSDVLNNAFYFLLKRDNIRFYLLGPNIDGISDGFAEKYNAVFFKTDYSLVEQNVIDIYTQEKGFPKPKKKNKEKTLFKLLLELKNEQTMIYCSSPASARKLAKSFFEFIKDRLDISKEEISLIEWIEKNVSKDWSLVDFLRYGIAFHDGALQKHITSSVIKYFNDKKINYLFCTSTIIEGINTSAKNIIIFDNKKGGKPIDYFDYSNIKGRAGRMMIHYTGKVYNFNSPVNKEQMVIDIPFFQQSPIKDEVLIHLDDNEIKDKDSEQYKKIKKIPTEEKKLFRKNGVLVDGQKKILEILRKDINSKHDLIVWNGYPKWEQLKYILALAWDNLLKEGETISPMNKNNLPRVVFGYSKKKTIFWLVDDTYNNLKEKRNWANENQENILKEYKELSKEQKLTFKKKDDYKKMQWSRPYFQKDDNELYNEAIRESFNILRHWFQYKVPKWLRVINSLQEFVCNEQGIKAGNYSYYADIIESDFVRDNLSILLEYGIPRSAIDKLEKKIKSDISEDEVIKILKKSDFLEMVDLLEYEKEKIIESL
jgi:late competence protein required for DNA uptake (superfamily II DNA/RNA helicase)